MTQTILYNLTHFYFWGPGDVGTAATDIHTEIGHNIPPLYTLIFGDLATVPKDIHTEIETQYTTPITLSFGDLGMWGQYARIYIWR